MVWVQWQNRGGSYLLKYADEYWARHDIRTAPPWTKPIALFKPKLTPIQEAVRAGSVGKYEYPGRF